MGSSNEVDADADADIDDDHEEDDDDDLFVAKTPVFELPRDVNNAGTIT